jgi:hypothetical protein
MTQPIKVLFEPQDDITTQELAQIVGIVIRGMAEQEQPIIYMNEAGYWEFTDRYSDVVRHFWILEDDEDTS